MPRNQPCATPNFRMLGHKERLASCCRRSLLPWQRTWAEHDAGSIGARNRIVRNHGPIQREVEQSPTQPVRMHSGFKIWKRHIGNERFLYHRIVQELATCRKNIILITFDIVVAGVWIDKSGPTPDYAVIYEYGKIRPQKHSEFGGSTVLVFTVVLFSLVSYPGDQINGRIHFSFIFS